MTNNRKILVVDDQEDLREQMLRLFSTPSSTSETGSLIDQIRSRISKDSPAQPQAASTTVMYDVDSVGQGKDAYEMVKSSFADNHPYALVFLDMRMPPGWDGLETAQRIRGIDREVNFVIMTAYADYDQQEIADSVGEPDKLIYLKKPFHPEEIRQLALALTEKWNLTRQAKETLILTNRLMRENASLTRRNFADLDDTMNSILDAFVSFLDAGAGVLVRCDGDSEQVCAATSPEDRKRLPSKVPSDARESARISTDEDNGTGVFPLRFDGFEGYLYIAEKNIDYPFDQLNTYLDILVETSREVLKNAFLVRHRQGNGGTTSASVNAAFLKATEDAIVQIRTSTAAIPSCDLAEDRAALGARITEIVDRLSGLCRDARDDNGDGPKK